MLLNRNIKPIGKFLLNTLGCNYRVQDSLKRFAPAEGLPQAETLPLDESIDKLLHDLERQACFVGRWGTVEYECMLGALNLRKWFESRYSDADLTCMSRNAGFFPANDIRLLDRFARLYAKCSAEFTHQRLHSLGTCPGESGVARHLNPGALLMPISSLALDRPARRWLEFLNGKRVLIVSAFVKDMKMQFPNLQKIWGTELQVPDFEPVWIEAVQSRGSSPAIQKYDNWFEALGYMKGTASNLTYDCALLSCGAYSVPLGSFIYKQMERTAICVGGDLQLLFGLRGPRWDQTPTMLKTYNGYWWYPRFNIGDQDKLQDAERYTNYTSEVSAGEITQDL